MCWRSARACPRWCWKNWWRAWPDCGSACASRLGRGLRFQCAHRHLLSGKRACVRPLPRLAAAVRRAVAAIGLRAGRRAGAAVAGAGVRECRQDQIPGLPLDRRCLRLRFADPEQYAQAALRSRQHSAANPAMDTRHAGRGSAGIALLRIYGLAPGRSPPAASTRRTAWRWLGSGCPCVRGAYVALPLRENELSDYLRQSRQAATAEGSAE